MKLHRFSLAAQRSLLQFSQKPTPTSLTSLLKVNPNWIQQELPHRYFHLIKFLSLRQSTLEPVLNRYLKDVDLLANTGKGLDLTRLKNRNHKSLSILKSLPIEQNVLERILTLNYGVEVLLDEYIALQAKKENLVANVNVIDVAQEAVDFVLEKSTIKPQINIINSTGAPITTLYIKSHLRYMIQELLQSSLETANHPSTTPSTPPCLTLMIACGKEDITVRLTHEEEPSTNPSPSVSSPPPPSSPPSSSRVQKLSLAKLIAKYWGGDIETVKSGNSLSSYLHISLKDGRERIPPILETMPMSLLELILDTNSRSSAVVEGTSRVPALVALKK